MIGRARVNAKAPGEWINGEWCLLVNYCHPKRLDSLPMLASMKESSLAVTGAECRRIESLGRVLKVDMND